MSTIFGDCEQALVTYLAANWTDTPIHWPNTKQPPVERYLRVNLIPVTPVLQAEIGENGMARMDVILQLDYFEKLGQGSGRATSVIDQLITLFPRNLKLAAGTRDMTFSEPSPLAGREDGHGYWMQSL